MEVGICSRGRILGQHDKPGADVCWSYWVNINRGLITVDRNEACGAQSCSSIEEKRISESLTAARSRVASDDVCGGGLARRISGSCWNCNSRSRGNSDVNRDISPRRIIPSQELTVAVRRGHLNGKGRVMFRIRAVIGPLNPQI